MEIKAPDFRKREDKLSTYLEGEVKNFLFDSFSDDYCTRVGAEFLRGVQMPFKTSDLTAFVSEDGLDMTSIADNMVRIMGANTKFAYRDAYIAYMAMFFDEKLIKVLINNGVSELRDGNYKRSCIYFRAALLLDSQDRDAMFGYACCCREWYLSLAGGDEQELVSLLKAESTEYLEWTSRIYEDYAAAYYYLGYNYANAGLYAKASFTWNEFLRLRELQGGEEESPEVEEIRERLESLEDPVKIEEGVNHLISGRYAEGLKVLETYVGSEYDGWWPLHYNLATAYRELGHLQEALEGYNRVIAINPSHIESCEALGELYSELGDPVMAEKYSKKAELLRKQQNLP